MKSFFRIIVLVFPVLLAACDSKHHARELHVYNWSDYIGKDTISNFEKQTGIKVTYDVYDSNEVLESKLLAGKSGYDVVFPTARPFADRQIKAGIYRKLDKSVLTNFNNLDPAILQSLSDIDPEHEYLAPYMWGTTGIGYNVEKVKAILGEEMPLDSWRLLFDPVIVKKLSACGVTLMDDPTEVFVAARIYGNKSTRDFSPAALREAADIVKSVRPSIRYFHSSQYINDLANGDICVAMGYSGDVLQARSRAKEAGNNTQIAYIAPSQGAVFWNDSMMIPKDAPHPDEALLFINYMLDPKVIADVSNTISYANANATATSLMAPEITGDPAIYPQAETRQHFITVKTPSEDQAREMNRIWTEVKTGQ